jgi:hypothetical protein
MSGFRRSITPLLKESRDVISLGPVRGRIRPAVSLASWLRALPLA